MVVVVGIYLFLYCIAQAMFFYNGMSGSPWVEPGFWIGAPVIAISIVALMAVVARRQFFSAAVWKVLFVVAVLYHTITFMSDWEALGGPSSFSASFIVSYLFLVVPPLLALGFLAFKQGAATDA